MREREQETNQTFHRYGIIKISVVKDILHHPGKEFYSPRSKHSHSSSCEKAQTLCQILNQKVSEGYVHGTEFPEQASGHQP